VLGQQSSLVFVTEFNFCDEAMLQLEWSRQQVCVGSGATFEECQQASCNQGEPTR